MNQEVSSKSIEGISDLVVFAPINDGFIDAFENVTYETRLRLVAEALHAVRKSAREHELISPFPDTAERILTLLDFRIGIVDQDLFKLDLSNSKKPAIHPKKHMYLVATFDGPWEPYMRLIWNPLGAFLDLVLCNCEGYVTATDHSFEEYIDWVRAHQLDSAIFYATSSLTVKDQLYLQKLEKIQRETIDHEERDNLIARMTSDNPDILAAAARKKHPHKTNALALEALTVLYRLADFYPPDRLDGDGRYLLRAAKSLLGDWNANDLPDDVKVRYDDILNWFNLDAPESEMPCAPDPEPDDSEVQKGLLTDYDIAGEPSTHGALLLMQVVDPAKARDFLNRFPISWEGGCAEEDVREDPFASVIRNISFTYHGLARLDLSDDALAAFPKEFKDGMVKRAPLFGDVGGNHPRRWRLPLRNWPRSKDASYSPVELDEIDFVFQFRTIETRQHATPIDEIDFYAASAGLFEDFYEKFGREFVTQSDKLGAGAEPSFGDSPRHPVELLRKFQNMTRESSDARSRTIESLIALIGLGEPLFGIRLLAVENMFRAGANECKSIQNTENSEKPEIRDHFGFRDGLSQPVIAIEPSKENEVLRGEILCGYKNMRGDYASTSHQDLFLNSSYLALRKMSQNVAALHDFEDEYGEKTVFHLMGRDYDGNLLNGKSDNEFNYDDDPGGELIPLASHIRRANPRNSFHGRKSPRILRRGMTYGKRYEDAPDEERGIMFMAYNASLAEQYEIVQRWVNGGNSTNIAAAQLDPIVSLNAVNSPYTFRYIDGCAPKRVTIKKPLTRLEWGSYFFVPSRTALRKICESEASYSLNELAGKATIRRLEALEKKVRRREWKRLLEDFLTKDPSQRGESINLWTAIRNCYGGAYRIDDGVEGRTPEESAQSVVLVAHEDLILKVLSDSATYSVSEQGARTKQSFGSIYVAQDPDSAYYNESERTNEILFSRGEQEAFDVAYNTSQAILMRMQTAAESLGLDFIKFELRREYFMPLLGGVCQHWFGIPDEKYVKTGPWNWRAAHSREARCPGDYMAPSRHAFYPRPTHAIAEYGKLHGRALKDAVDNLVAERRQHGVSGVIAKEMFAAISDDDLLARNLIGAMTGALPPIDGNLRGVFFDWLDQSTLWRHQGAYHNAQKGDHAKYDAAAAALRRPIMTAMCKRPAPDLIYRTAISDATLGDAGTCVKKGDQIILALVSATQARLAAGKDLDVSIVFGGERDDAQQSKGKPVHACPAYKLAMGTIMGATAALFDSGRIHALPASLIIKVSDWDPS